MNVVRSEGTVTASGQTYELPVAGYAGAAVQVSGTFTATLVFEGSTNGISFTSLQAVNVASGAAVTSATGAGQWQVAVAGLYTFRVRCSSYTSGAATVVLQATEAAASGGGSGGGGGGGAVTIADGADVAEGSTTDAAVTGDNDGSVNAHLRGMDKILADVWDSVGHALNTNASVSVTGVATAANQTNASQKTQIVDGSGNVIGSHTNAMDVSVRDSALPTGAATSAKQDTGNTSLASIDGKITAVNTGAVVVSSSALPTGAATAAKQPALGTAGTPSADVISVQGVGGGTALPVSGTVTANLAAGTNNIGDVDVLTVPADPFGANADAASATGSISAKLRFIASTGIPITGTVTVGSHAVTNAGVFAVQESGSALTSLQLIDDGVATVASAVPTKGMAAAGTDGTNARLLKTDTNGELQVDVLTLPALAAGTNLVGQVSASPETSTVYNGTTALTPKFARISASTNGDNTVVAAVVAKKIRVLALNLMAVGTVTVNFQTAVAGAYLAGPYPFIANTGIVLPFNPAGWFETVAGDLLNLELNAAVAVGGSLTYVEV